MKQVVNSLKELGFTEYEAKIYLALLRSHPANGNAIATLSGVPTPKVYETLRKMQENELVFPVSVGEKGKKVGYTPLPYEDLLRQKKKAFTSNVDFLSDALVEISSMGNTDWTELFVIHGYSPSLDAVESAIANSKTEIIISCWFKEFEVLRDVLTEAYERGVQIVMLTFGEEIIEVPWKNFSHYNVELTLLRHAGELSIVIDQSKAIVLQSLNNSPHAVVSSHPVTILTTRNYIRHDIYVNQMIVDFEEVAKERYGPDLDGLINRF